MTNDRLHKLAGKGIDEFRRFSIMFLYLWMVFGLLVLNESVVLRERHISFTSQGFALINAAILAKVMLIAEDLKLGRSAFKHSPLVVPVAYKSGLFAAVFIVFHVLERVLVGTFAGKSIAESMPHMGGGTWQGLLTVWAIMFVSLLPFFALREIGQVIGEGKLWSLFFNRPSRT